MHTQEVKRIYKQKQDKTEIIITLSASVKISPPLRKLQKVLHKKSQLKMQANKRIQGNKRRPKAAPLTPNTPASSTRRRGRKRTRNMKKDE